MTRRPHLCGPLRVIKTQTPDRSGRLVIEKGVAACVATLANNAIQRSATPHVSIIARRSAGDDTLHTTFHPKMALRVHAHLLWYSMYLSNNAQQAAGNGTDRQMQRGRSAAALQVTAWVDAPRYTREGGPAVSQR